MKHVTFLIADGMLKPSSLFNSIEIFENANEFHFNKSGKTFYEVCLGRTNLQQKVLNSSFSFNVRPLKAISAVDLIILPGFDYQEEFAIRKSREALDWITNNYRAGAEVASLCPGTLLLAATGLLEGKPCATHWKAETHFRQLFPKLELYAH